MKTTSTAEDLLAAQLDAAGYTYQREYQFHPKRRWRADFYLPAHSLIVEVEGIGYGRQMGRHQVGQSFQADCEKYNEMALRGLALLRFTPAMIRGKAKRLNKAKEPMPSAIDTIGRFVDRS